MLIGILSFLCCIGCFYISIVKNKSIKLISPITIFFGLWSLILGLSLLGLYNIIRPSSEAYALILIMLVSFFIGSILGNKIKLHTKRRAANKSKNAKFLVLYAICILIIIFNIIDIVLVLIHLSHGTPMWQIRNWTLEPYGSSNPILSRRSFIEEIVRTMICSPMMIVLPAATSYYWFNSKNKAKNYSLMGLTITILCLNAISSGGGRLSFLYLILCLCASYYIARKTKQIKKRSRKSKRMTVIIVSSITIMVIATIARTGVGNLFKQFYTYFALPPTLLSLWLPTLQNTPHTMGLLTTFGIHSYIFRLLNIVGLNALVPAAFSTAFTTMLNAEKFLQVGYGVGNAFVTPVYYFYADGGAIFTILASLVFGIVISIITRKISRNLNARNYIIYALILYGVFVSFMRIQTVIPGYIISFIFAFWLFGESQTSCKCNEILNVHTKSKLSIILPIYNGQKYINACIHQLEKIKNINYEIIIINDGSTDKTLAKARNLERKFRNITLINIRKNSGVSHARNMGIKAATGDYIIGVDVDDDINPEMYEFLLKNAALNKADISMCDYYERYGDLCLNSKYNYSQEVTTQPTTIREYLLDKTSNNIWDKVFKKDLLIDIAFNEKLHIGEDILFCLQAFYRSRTTCKLPSRLLGYVQNSTSAMHTINTKMTEYKNIEKYIPTSISKSLEKQFPEEFNYFRLEMIVRGIHAISAATDKKNHREATEVLSRFYTKEELKRIINNKIFNKAIRLEMWVLLHFGVKTHLRLTHIYKFVKEVSR